MDDLLKEIERKKSNLLQTKQKLNKKYFKRGELERLREEEYLKKQREIETERSLKKVKVAGSGAGSGSGTTTSGTASGTPSIPVTISGTNSIPDIPTSTPILDVSQVKKRLRVHKQPVTLFGESDEERIKRLKKVESVEERSRAVTFKSLVDANEQDLTEDLLKGDLAETVQEKDDIDTTGISVDLIKNDKEFGCDLILAYFKRLFRQWERKLQSRTDDVKRSTKDKASMVFNTGKLHSNTGKLQSIALAQAAEHLKPFWEGLKKRDLAMDILIRIADVCRHLQNNAFHKANDTYIRLSIGNAPWPIGVTGSGMHARVGDDKIRTDEVAHVLNDETTRKWIQSVKRLMTFAEESYLDSKTD